MRRSLFVGALLLSAAFLFVSPDLAQAKEVPPDGNIPLTSEYFPDESFLKHKAMEHDKNKDGYLSPEEIEAVTSLWFGMDLTDFSQVQYFTNLKNLSVETDEWSQDEVWIGTNIDLTVFPDLENVLLRLDSRRAPAGSPDRKSVV